jgi:hypothetical protein
LGTVDSMKAVDLGVARLVYEAHVLERAVHDPGPWELGCGHYRVKAWRVLHNDSVTFEAMFVASERMRWPLELYCNGELLLTRPWDDEVIGRGVVKVRWRLSPQPIQVSV